MLAKPALESLKRAALIAEAAGLEVEVIVVLDRCDTATRDVVARHDMENFITIETDFGDLGMARNDAVVNAKSEYVAFLDADDLWGANWLTQAVRTASAHNSKAVIWHPEVSVYIGVEPYVFRHIDMGDKDFNPSSLMIENYWTALSFGPRAIYLDNPFPDNDLTDGFGFEDWAWNMHTISRGIVHKIVPGTGHIIRRREQSLSRQTIDAKAVHRPTQYLKHYIQSRMGEIANTFCVISGVRTE